MADRPQFSSLWVFCSFSCVSRFACLSASGGSAEEDFAGESVYAGQLRKLIQISKWPSRRSPTVDVGHVRQLWLLLCVDAFIECSSLRDFFGPQVVSSRS
jgi:hypothetical protein